MSNFTYTPYDGTTTPFTMGLRPLEPSKWIEVDDKADIHLAEKKALYAARPQDVFAALPDTQEAQRECLSLVVAHIGDYFPDRFKLTPETIGTIDGKFHWDVQSYVDTPLALTGQIVQEDFCLINPHGDEPILAAASLCFPSSWTLRDKIGKSLDLVHAPVPGYQKTMAPQVNRMMQNMPDDRIVWRMNWSLDEGPDLFRPLPHSHDAWLAAKGNPFDHIFIRVERQTLRRLPNTGYVIFTIRIYTDCLGNLAHHPAANKLAQGLHQQLTMLTDDQLAYKGLSAARPVILEALQKLL